MKNQKAQGSIEYLLLLGAVMIVAAIVVSYMSGILGPTIDEGNRSNYDYLCGPKSNGGLDSNSLLCGCYLKDSKKGERLPTGEYVPADQNIEICPKKLDQKYHNDSLLVWKKSDQ